MPTLQDLTGMQFGKWKVLTTFRQNGRTYCDCLCTCGKTKTIQANHLKTKASQGCNSCGNRRHGDSRSALYDVWTRIKGSKHGCCISWRSYLNFKQWAVSNNWRQGLWVHRKRDLGHYSPQNCYIDIRHEEAKGGQSKYRKLRPIDIPEIFRLRNLGLFHRQIATKFNCCTPAITQVLNRTRWSHIDI